MFMQKQSVLILCTSNSARSQMAEGLLRHMAGDRFNVESAGTTASFVRPQAIAAMKEINIDISGHRSKLLDVFLETPFDHVITVCDEAGQKCPLFPGLAKRMHWSFEDPANANVPAEAVAEVYRRVCDQIAEKLRAFIDAEKMH